MSYEKLTLSTIIAQAQKLSLMVEDATTGECADCTCNSCVTLRSMAEMVKAE